MIRKNKITLTGKLFFILLALSIQHISCSDDKELPSIDLSELQLQVKAKANHPDLHTDLFPSFLYLAEGLQKYYKEEPKEIFTDQVLELSFTNPAKGTIIELSTRESDLTEGSSWQYTTGEEETVNTLLPVTWKRESLKKWKETAQLTLIWDITINRQKAGSLHQVFTCHDIRQFPERIFTEGHKFVGTLRADRDGAIYPAALISAYICENNPLVNELLQQAETDGAIDRFDGYTRGDDQIVNQLCAMWYVLLKNNITYGNHYFVPGYWSERYIRRVRNINEVLESRTGNCMELPMTLMAMCYHAGLKVVSFHVDNAPQDHMFMGILNSKGELAHVLNPAYIDRMNWEDKTREEQISIAKQQLIALLEIGKSEYAGVEENIIIGIPHYEMVNFERVREFIPSLE